MRDIEGGDNRSRKLLAGKVNSVFDLWSWGRTYYYGPKAASRNLPSRSLPETAKTRVN